MLAHVLAPSVDPTGMWVSEKLDGSGPAGPPCDRMRALFVNGVLYSRNGHPVPAPRWFVDAMPHGEPLDGELWRGRARGPRGTRGGVSSSG